MLRKHCVLSGGGINFMLCLLSGKGAKRDVVSGRRGIENNKYFISSTGNRTQNLSRLRAHACTPLSLLTSNNNFNK